MKKKIDFILILIGFYIIPIDSSYVHDQIANNKNLIVLTKIDKNFNSKSNSINHHNNNNKTDDNINNINYISRNHHVRSDTFVQEKNNTKVKNERYKRDKLQNVEFNRNYYYEEQKPLLILPSEAGPIGIQDFAGNTNKNSNSNNLTNNYYFDNYKNKYLTTTPSSSDFNELSSVNNDEYNDSYEYESSENDQIRQSNRANELNENSNSNQNQNFGSIMTQAKNLWDIYNAFNTAWNVMTRSQANNNENDLKETLINNFSNSESSTEAVKQFELNAKSQRINESSRENLNQRYNTNSKSLLENLSTALSKRDVANSNGEGRYIKGDPLKGYYDFVITEGSYKFWAAFQLATAILIIYSTFAAIYYSKVNPLVGDYDYVDYLGGGRSLSDDSDFIDDNVDNTPYSKSKPILNDNENNNNYSLNKLIPKLGHSIKFILESIDKLPNKE